MITPYRSLNRRRQQQQKTRKNTKGYMCLCEVFEMRFKYEID